MDQDLNLKQVDTDGAIQEAAAMAQDALGDGDTRLDFLKKAGLASGALVGGGAVLSALTPAAASAKSGEGRPPAKFGKGDVGILNYALTLEYLEAAFYNEATSFQNKTHFIKNEKTRAFLKRTTADENAHVAFLKKALGTKAVAEPTFDFGPATRSASKFLKYAFTFENTGVHAYLGQALNIQSPAYVEAALSITAVEARHASVAGLILKHSPYGVSPDGAFDTGFAAGKVLQAVEGLGVIR